VSPAGPDAAAGPVVLVVGDVIDDVIVRPRGPVRPDTDTPADITATPGGSGANQAAWLAHAGVRTRFAGRVGAADVARHTAVLAGVGVEAVLAADPVQPTGTIVILVEGSTRTMLTDRGANVGLVAADLPDALLDGVGTLLLSGYALFEPGVRAAVTDLAHRARDRGAVVAVDPASAGFLTDVGPATFLGWMSDLGGVGLLLPNATEARLLAEAAAVPIADAATALRAHARAVVVKLGADGALVASEREVTAVAAVPADVVDPTGAGDAFAAGLLAARAAGADLVAAARAGCALAARAVALTGARPPGGAVRS
jgi:sugar/nucleoside kinase (ribokinase family)